MEPPGAEVAAVHGVGEGGGGRARGAAAHGRRGRGAAAHGREAAAHGREAAPGDRWRRAVGGRREKEEGGGD